MWSPVLEDYAEEAAPKTLADYESLTQKWFLELDQLRNAGNFICFLDLI